nr:hypothetical protein [Streptomyces humi]
MSLQSRRVASQQLVKVGKEDGRGLAGFTDAALVACFNDVGDVCADDRQGVSLDQHARKVMLGQTDDRIVPGVREQLSLYTLHVVTQPQT